MQIYSSIKINSVNADRAIGCIRYVLENMASSRGGKKESG